MSEECEDRDVIAVGGLKYVGKRSSHMHPVERMLYCVGALAEEKRVGGNGSEVWYNGGVWYRSVVEEGRIYRGCVILSCEGHTEGVRPSRGEVWRSSNWFAAQNFHVRGDVGRSVPDHLARSESLEVGTL